MPRPGVYLVWYHFETMDDIKKLAPSSPSVLDLGCGEGLLARELRQLYPVVGLDLSLQCLRMAVSGSATESWVQGNATDLPFRDNSLDVVVSHQMIEHLSSRGGMIRNVSRILKPGGLFIVTTPVRGPMGSVLARSRNRRGERVLSPDHLSEYSTSREMVESFSKESNGTLKLIKLTERSVQVPIARHIPIVRRSKRLGPMLPALLYYSDVYGVFKKEQSGITL